MRAIKHGSNKDQIKTQESIPIGCVLPTFVLGGGGFLSGPMFLVGV